MTVSTEKATGNHVTTFEQTEHRALGGEQSFLTPLRKAAIARFAELGFPTTRDEEWRSTNVAPIANTTFTPADPDDSSVSADDLSPFLFADDAGGRLVFVNGRFSERLSHTGSLPSGLTIIDLRSALESQASLLEKHLARHACYREQAFTALNTAFLDDGALIHVARGTVIEQPIHLVFLMVGDTVPTVVHPRTLIVVEDEAQVSLVESYVGLAGPSSNPNFTNAVTEMVAGENAVIDHYKVQRETVQAYHIAHLSLHQQRSSNVTSHSITIGGGLVRNEIHVVLDGDGCECTLNGLYVTGDGQHVDNHLRVDHVMPHCRSWEYYKGILDGSSSAVFSGRINVHKDAQKTDAKQTNMNLLLSEGARVDTKPQLEILADDVKCTHGATIGQIDSEAIFYLRTRGISESAARSLLVYAFAGESLDQVRIAALRAQLRKLLLARLPHGVELEETT